MAKVTIAIPFYNGEKYLGKAIKSVIDQTYTDWELLLIDDGSNDSSFDIAKYYENQDHRIKIYKDGENKNLGYRLNQIPSLVDTEYLCRMDADDIMHPQKIMSQITYLENNPETDILGTNAYSIDSEDNVQGIRFLPENSLATDVRSFIHPTIMGRTEWFKNNPYDVNAIRIEDAELWLRTYKLNNFKTLNQPLFFYREFGSKYYQKYFKGIPSLFYIIKKHRFKTDFIFFGIKYVLSSIKMYLYYFFGKEDVPIKNRNKVVFKKSAKVKDLL